MKTPRYRDRREAAAYLTDERGLKISAKYLAKLACVGGGPRYSMFGIRAIYTDENLDEWADAKISEPRTSTSELMGAA